DVLGLAVGRGLHDHVAAGGPDDGRDRLRLDEAGAEVGVPVGAGVEGVPAVVGVHQVDPAGDGLDPVHDAGQVLAAGMRVAGVQAEARSVLADRVPQFGDPVQVPGHRLG